MVCTELQEDRFDLFKQQLIERVQQKPFEVSFNVTITVNETEYLLKVMIEGKRKIYILQALKIRQEEQNQAFELITSKGMLSALLDIVIWQWIS